MLYISIAYSNSLRSATRAVGLSECPLILLGLVFLAGTWYSVGIGLFSSYRSPVVRLRRFGGLVTRTPALVVYVNGEWRRDACLASAVVLSGFLEGLSSSSSVILLVVIMKVSFRPLLPCLWFA